MVVEVVDTGIGIPFDELAHLTEPWFRARNATASGIGGDGLGLTLVRGCRAGARGRGVAGLGRRVGDHRAPGPARGGCRRTVTARRRRLPLTGLEVLRTPEHRFADVPGYDHPPRYVEADAGDGSAPGADGVRRRGGGCAAAVCLMLHGEPSWGFLYRRVVDAVVAAGYRAVVPDLIGFGRSDKPADPQDYTYARHVAWVRSFLHELALSGVTLLCQDWGGLIGLRIVGQQPGALRRGRRGQHLPAGRRTGAAGLPRLAAVLAGGAPVPGRLRAAERDRDHAPAAGRRGLRGALSRRVVHRRRPALPDARPDRARRPGSRRQPRGLAGSGGLRPAVRHRVLRRRPGDPWWARPGAAGAG